MYCLGDEPLTPGGDFEDTDLKATLGAELAKLKAAPSAAAKTGPPPIAPVGLEQFSAV
jgi:hypothetical protein